MDDFKLGSLTFNQLSNPTLSPFQAPTLQTHDHRTFDPTAPILIPEPERSRKTTRTNKYGVPGYVEDMLPVFDACIRVGKLDRAALVLKRLNSLGILSREEQILLSNQYLRASLQQLKMVPDRNQAEQLHKWYELQIRAPQLPHTAETIACMLKASLLSERGSRLDRLVMRYMGMASGEAGLRVLSMADILSDQDLAVITEICPTYNYSASAEQQASVTLSEDVGDVTMATQLDETQAASDTFPEIYPTPQKGHGLKTLSEGIQLLTRLEDVDMSQMTDNERREIQMQVEKDSIGSAMARWRLEHEDLQRMGINSAIGNSKKEGSLGSQMGTWLVAMEKRLKEEFVLVEESEKKPTKSEEDLQRCLYGPVLMQADPARLAAVTILSVVNAGSMPSGYQGVVVSRIVTSLVKLVQEDLQMQMKEDREKLKKRSLRRRKIELKSMTSGDEMSTETIPVDAESTVRDDMEQRVQKPWSLQIRAQVGTILIKTLIETAKIKVAVEHPVTKEIVHQYQPAFCHSSQPRKGKKVGTITLNSHLSEQLRSQPQGEFFAKHLPMVAEPKPWRRLNEGGFLDSKTSLVRVRPGEVEQRLYAKAAIKCGDMKQVFKGLDVLGKTAWQINKKVLSVMIEAWNSGDAIANMPPLNPTLETVPEPDSAADPLLRRAWMKAIRMVENERSGLHSQRCFMNLQLEIARVFRNQTIYFPHNVDYRGRAYPMPTYLNHMGADHTRGLLKFARGKELGKGGLRWLKIHLANVYGLDKASFDEREAFTTENMASVIESATNPLSGSRWWLKGEDPWQCLAACFELKAAFDLPDPTTFISQLPVHQDGTCNGLQHYAALGGDTWGAKQVNLEPGDRPADVYSAVADLVKQGIAKDAEEGNKYAVAMMGKITRKVVKQTVMTNVYGVTFVGAKKQVCKQIDALYPHITKETGIGAMLLASYVARHIFQALTSMFRGAHDIQYWLGDVGGRVCRALTPAQMQQIAEEYSAAKGRPSVTKRKGATGKAGFDELAKQFRSTVVWTTPLRMPVAQPYRKNASREIRTCLQSIVYPVVDQTDPVNRRKQLQGFPPNFIHSLDASHMLLSALKCDEVGLTFAAVHDSFWTHAGDIDTMNQILRDAFIRIHEEDVVGRLATEFEARHRGSVYLAHIDPKSAVAKRIRELRTKSKMSAKEELLLEYKRNSLRLSGAPWDLEAAKQIVTPASIFEEMSAADGDAEINEDANSIVGLGAITENEPDAEEDVSADVVDYEFKDEVEDVQDDSDAEHTSEGSGHDEEGEKLSQFASRMKEKAPQSPSSYQPTLQLWLPLTIPPVPKKVRQCLLHSGRFQDY